MLHKKARRCAGNSHSHPAILPNPAICLYAFVLKMSGTFPQLQETNFTRYFCRNPSNTDRVNG